MGITYTLPNFPLKNQRLERTNDGGPLVNGDYDCVEVSVAAAAQWYDGGYISGDWLKDAVLGEPYQGGSAASEFVAWCAANLHMRLVPVGAHNSYLVSVIHDKVGNAHCPVVLTIPSEWGETLAQLGWTETDIHGWTHVVVACGVGPGMVRLMNPWLGAYQDVTDEWLVERMCFDQIWVCEYIAGGSSNVSLDTTGLGTGFRAMAVSLNASQCSGGEHQFTQTEAFAAFRSAAGVETVGYWNSQTQNLSDTKPATVAVALWQQREAYRLAASQAQAAAQSAQSQLASATTAAQNAATALAQAQQKYTTQAQALQGALDAMTQRAQAAEALLAKLTAQGGQGNPNPPTPTPPANVEAARKAVADAQLAVEEVLDQALHVPAENATTPPAA